MSAATFTTRRGVTIIELMVALVLISILMLAVTVSVHREARSLSDVTHMTAAETRAEEMLDRIEHRLEYAQGATPSAFLTMPLDNGEAGIMETDTTLGFPDSGVLLLQPGTGFEERIAYEDFLAVPVGFANLERAQRCTESEAHPAGERVRWAGIAEQLEDQNAPPPEFYDGVSMELFGPTFYRGDGTGFSFRVPVDPDGGTDFFEGSRVRWGANVRGDATPDGWSALYFEPVAVVTEAARGLDVNSDGDRDDTFDLGRIRLRSWNTVNPAGGATDVALCPAIVLQEQCDYGADMDNDGFEDPIFLWDPTTGRLRVRIFLIAGTVAELTVIRRMETVLFLRNGANG